MCGNVTLFHPTKNVDTRVLMDFFLRQRSRGTDGYGFSYLTETDNIIVKRFEFEAECFHELSRVRSRLIQFHHRNPTSTDNIVHQNHPIVRRTEKGFYALTHNGIISNHFEMKTGKFKDVEYSTKGKTDVRTNDSESLLHDLVSHMEDGNDLESEGSIAFVLMEGDSKGKFKALHFGRNSSNPLRHALYPEGLHVISSINDDETTEDSFMIDDSKLFTVTFSKGKVKQTERPIVFPLRRAATAYQGRGAYMGYNTSPTIPKDKPVKETKTDQPETLGEKRRIAQEDYRDMFTYAEELIRDMQPLNSKSKYGDMLDALTNLDMLRREILDVSMKAYGHETRKTKELVKVAYDERSRLLGYENFTDELKERRAKHEETEQRAAIFSLENESQEAACTGFLKKKSNALQVVSKQVDPITSITPVPLPSISVALAAFEDDWERSVYGRKD